MWSDVVVLWAVVRLLGGCVQSLREKRFVPRSYTSMGKARDSQDHDNYLPQHQFSTASQVSFLEDFGLDSKLMSADASPAQSFPCMGVGGLYGRGDFSAVDEAISEAQDRW